MSRVWALLGARAGDNAQVRSLATLLGEPFVEKQMTFNRLHSLPNTLLGASLRSLVEPSLIAPPWPDLVIGVGKRLAPIARYIRKASAGQTKTVHIGRPRAPLADFDLVISTPQYALPEAANVIVMKMPFVNARSLSSGERDRWAAQWQELERPWTIAAIGGPKFPLSLGPTELEQFGTALNEQVTKTGGSVILMSSPRSHHQALELVATRLSCPSWYDLDRSSGNPYLAALSLGDRFAVTGDSVSMIGEMLETRRPVGVLRLPVSPIRMRWHGGAAFAGALSRAGLLQPPRDVDGLVAKLFADGHVHAVGNPHAVKPLIRDDHAVVARVKALLA
jgi:uncharacterized protein